jgi:mono/diheme cytochrome c family protein
VLVGAAACHGSARDDSASLAFLRRGKPERTLTLAALEARIPAEVVAMNDPYYARPKRFRALPLARVLDEGFGRAAGGVRADDEPEIVFRALDGYTVPMRLEAARAGGAYIAFADVDVPGWEAIGPSRVSPAPFYLVWAHPDQQDLETHPRPWQLASVELASFESVFPHTSPGEVPAGSPVARGYTLFQGECIHCHAVNREGGRVGPDLNVPRSIVEYRPEAQIREYIRDPRSFRYSAMPPHPHLTDADLDGLIAYFHAMSARKNDLPPR